MSAENKDKMGPSQDISEVDGGVTSSPSDEKSTVEVVGDNGASHNYALANDPHRWVQYYIPSRGGFR